MIVVVGDLLVDVLVRHAGPLAHGSDTPATTTLTPGGQGANVAAWLARAGADAHLVGCVGDDALAALALKGLAPGAPPGLAPNAPTDHCERRSAREACSSPTGMAGADGGVRRVAGAATGTCVVLVGPGGERTMLPDPGANAALTVDDLPPLGAGDVLYLSGYTLLREATRPVALAALARARAAGARTVLDPASAAPLAAAPGVLEAAGPVDLLLPNADEAAVLGEAAFALGREVVVTDGPRGAAWHGPDGAYVAVPALPAEVVDTTGAGDAFAAGFVSAWATGADPAEALTAGARLAAAAIARPGGRPAGSRTRSG